MNFPLGWTDAFNFAVRNGMAETPARAFADWCEAGGWRPGEHIDAAHTRYGTLTCVGCGIDALNCDCGSGRPNVHTLIDTDQQVP